MHILVVLYWTELFVWYSFKPLENDGSLHNDLIQSLSDVFTKTCLTWPIQQPDEVMVSLSLEQTHLKTILFQRPSEGKSAL